MHAPFAGGEVVRERPFLFLVFLRRASEGLLHVTGGGAEFRAVIEVVDEPVLIAKLIVLSHGGKPIEGQIILVIELSPKALALIGELTHLDGYAPVMVGTGKVKRAVLVPDLPVSVYAPRISFAQEPDFTSPIMVVMRTAIVLMMTPNESNVSTPCARPSISAFPNPPETARAVTRCG